MTFFLKKTALTRTIFFVFTDIILIALAVWLAFLFRFDGQIPSQYLPFIERMIGLLIVLVVPAFCFFGLYFFSWSYVSADELISLFKATTISFLLLLVIVFTSQYFSYFFSFPRTIIFISYVLIFVFCGTTRFSKRVYLHFLGRNRIAGKERTLIAGAGDAGEQILRSILSSKDSNYSPIGFVDDNPIKEKVTIHGFRVLGKINEIPALAKKHSIEHLIVALPAAGSKTIKNTVELGRRAGIKKIKIVPSIGKIMNREVTVGILKSVEAEDLLGRERAEVNMKEIEDFIKNKKVLITGAAGSIGSELSRQTAEFLPQELLLLDQDETGIFNISKEIEDRFPKLKIKSFVSDITDENKIKNIFEKTRPQIVFHAAAYKHVPLMEEHPDEAVKNNVFGTEILAKASANCGVENFVQISTDKAVNPTSVMGATKRACEMLCQLFNQRNGAKFVSVRFGNVLDSRGSVIPIFREQIKKGGPVEVTHPDMRRYFMLISEACLLVMQASAMGRGGEVFVLDMGKPIKILDLARDMIKLSGFEPDKDIAIVFSGTRPGEKLFEEILTAEEGTIATKNQKIFMAKLSQVNESFEKELENLKNIIAKNSRKEEIVLALKQMVPYYK